MVVAAADHDRRIFCVPFTFVATWFTYQTMTRRVHVVFMLLSGTSSLHSGLVGENVAVTVVLPADRAMMFGPSTSAMLGSSLLKEIVPATRFVSEKETLAPSKKK